MSTELGEGLLEMKALMDAKSNLHGYPTDKLVTMQPTLECPEDIPSELVAAFVDAIIHGFVIGAKVSVVASSQIGTVLGYNSSTCGIYNGARLPIVVEFTNGTFEYCVEDLELKEVPEDCPLTPFFVHQVEDRVLIQDGISGDRERAYKEPFKKQKQFNNDGPISVPLDDRYFGYIWAEDREHAATIGANIAGIDQGVTK